MQKTTARVGSNCWRFGRIRVIDQADANERTDAKRGKSNQDKRGFPHIAFLAVHEHCKLISH